MLRFQSSKPQFFTIPTPQPVVPAKNGKSAATTASATTTEMQCAQEKSAQRTKNALQVTSGKAQILAKRAGAAPTTKSDALGCLAQTPESPTPVDDANSES